MQLLHCSTDDQLSLRMQVHEVMVVSNAMSPVFAGQQWQELQGRLQLWRQRVVEIHGAVDTQACML